MGGRLSCCSCSSSSSSSSSSSLTEDMLFEILVCLPVKSLLRFKSVCKSWLSLIESSEFIYHHAITLPRPDNNNNNNLLGTFIFQYQHKNSGELLWSMFSVTNDHKSHVFEELPMQPYYRNPTNPDRILIVGSCNGLICLQDDELRDVSLWNPAINQFRILPKPLTFAGIGNGKVSRDFVAFGFDVETKDYKVVLVTYYFAHNISRFQYPYRVQVYSLSTDSWRPLEGLVMPTYPREGIWWQGGYHGGYLNGSYYGLGEDEQILGHPSMSLLSFDFTKEIFRTTQFPDGITYTKNITFLDEKVAIIDVVRNTYHHVWVLNELGVKESWTKLYTIGPYGLSVSSQIFTTRIGISNNGVLIFLTGSSAKKKLQLLNPSTLKSHEVKGLQILQYVGTDLKAVVYRRSLVPIGGTRKSSGKVVKLVKNPYYRYLCTSCVRSSLRLGGSCKFFQSPLLHIGSKLRSM